MSEINISYVHILDVYNSVIPKRIGAYIITHSYDNIHAERYVGSTRNLFSRMSAHWSKNKIGNMIYIDIYVTDDISLAQSLERILMELIEPATNRRIAPLSDDDNKIMSELLRDTKLKECVSNNVVKIGYRYLKYVNGDNGIFNPNRTCSLHISDDIHRILIRKQAELFNIEGKKRTLSEIVEKSIRKGINLMKAKQENLMEYVQPNENIKKNEEITQPTIP